MDIIETIDGSVIHHGRHNDRIYLMQLSRAAGGKLIAKLDTMAMAYGYGKIFAKIPATRWKVFKSAGYVREAVIPGFFKGTTDGLFIAKFFATERQEATHRKPVDRTERPSSADHCADSGPSTVDACTPSDTGEMSTLYRRMFESYPFPIHHTDYLKRVMAKNVIYFSIRVKKKIAAVAAAEIDPASQTCEMTDFATLPNYRGRGFAEKLLVHLEGEAHHRGVKTAYTIARADSHAMNRAFEKTGYLYAGQLIKNSQIGGRIRSMTVWYKHLQKNIISR